MADRLAANAPDAGALEQEILTHLVALNRERAAEEAGGNIRNLRPEFQNPGTQQPTTLNIQTTPQPTAATTATKHPWPATLPARVALVKSLLATVPPDPAILAAHLTGFATAKRKSEISRSRRLASFGFVCTQYCKSSKACALNSKRMFHIINGFKNKVLGRRADDGLPEAFGIGWRGQQLRCRVIRLSFLRYVEGLGQDELLDRHPGKSGQSFYLPMLLRFDLDGKPAHASRMTKTTVLSTPMLCSSLTSLQAKLFLLTMENGSGA